ncbi:MAG TPA: ABC transporter permease [Vicinamibacterales bacterium]|nr:ABC transporter permease [Vicinamibacterales bacterium]
MRLTAWIASVWRTCFRSGAVERDLDDEMRATVDLLADRYVAGGMNPAEARRAALVELGGVEQVKEQVREHRLAAPLETILLDLRYAWRTLWKAPSFAIVVLATLALGIGANTAIFSVVHAMLLSPLPYRDADRLIFVWSDMTDEGYPRAPLSGPELDDLRARSKTCAAFGAIWANTAALTGDDHPEQLRIGRVTDDFFNVLGAEAALGRTFRAEDARPGAAPTILLSWPVFERRYGADPSLVGRRILVNDRPTTVVGVMPRSFRLLLPPDSSVPDDLQAFQPFPAAMTQGPRGQQFLRVVGRMRPAVTVDQARADIDGVASTISRAFTEYGASGRRFVTVGLQSDDVREIRPALVALFAGVGILLLIACVNVASLLIARAAARRSEIALRLALGAARVRIVRQCLIEGLLLASLGAVAGLAAGWCALRAVTVVRPDALSRIELASIDWPVALFTFGIAIAWGVLFSMAPLTEIYAPDLLPELQRTNRQVDTLRDGVRRTLVVIQMALSVVLLVCAGLLVHTLMRVQNVDPGFRADDALTFRVAIPMQRYRPIAGFNTFARNLDEALRRIPGVQGVGAISHLPYDDLPNWGTPYLADAAMDDASAPNADARAVTPGLMETMGLQLQEGRFFTEADQPGQRPSIIVDDKLAARVWPGRSAIGQHLGVDPGSTGRPTVNMTVVGVVKHVRLRSLVADLTEQIYFPERLILRNPMAYVVRSSRDPAALAADVRAAIAALDPNLPIYDVRPLHTYVDGARAARRFTALLAAGFAVVALLLACVGVYGVMAYAVTRRRREFGVRLALGADPSRLAVAILRDGLTLAIAGALIGVLGAAAAGSLLRAQLYGVAPYDPPSFLITVGMLGVTCLLASWIPARRALAASPMEALRTE